MPKESKGVCGRASTWQKEEDGQRETPPGRLARSPKEETDGQIEAKHVFSLQFGHQFG